jgi:hypothetical protein
VNRPKFRDYKIRPKGSPEVAYDPLLIIQMYAQQKEEAGDPARGRRVVKIYNFILKVALEVLPPKQRKVFYSVWVRSNGKLNKGVMEYSRRTGQSHYTQYNNFYKAMNSVRIYLDRAGYSPYIIGYLRGEG